MRPESRIGTHLAGYRIQALIGRGGMGEVYLAEHVTLGRLEALKVLSPELSTEEGFRRRFQREARLAASLRHPNIIPVYYAGESDGSLYLVMPYIRGTDLKRLIDRDRQLEPEMTLRILEQVANALDAAHAEGLVHRDVKPANVLIEDDSLHVYLTDFGVTRHMDSKTHLTPTGHFLGTLQYVAPEQIEGKAVDARTDVYSLGCVLYECLTGAVPFQRESEGSLLWAHLSEAPPRLTDRRPDLARSSDFVVARSMAKRKEDRYESCRELIDAARTALLGETAHPPEARANPVPVTGPMAPPAGLPGPPAPAAETAVGREGASVPAASEPQAMASVAVHTARESDPAKAASAETMLEVESSGEPAHPGTSVDTVSAPTGETLAPVEVAPVDAAPPGEASEAAEPFVETEIGEERTLQKLSGMAPTLAATSGAGIAGTLDAVEAEPETVAAEPAPDTVAPSASAAVESVGAVTAASSRADPAVPAYGPEAMSAEVVAVHAIAEAPGEKPGALDALAVAPATIPRPPPPPTLSRGATPHAPPGALPSAGEPALAPEGSDTPAYGLGIAEQVAVPQAGGGPLRRSRRRILTAVAVALAIAVAIVAVAIAAGGGHPKASPPSAPTTTPPPVPVTAPTGLAVKASGGTKAVLTWVDDSTHVDGFRIFDNGTELTESIPANKMTFTVADLAKGSRHCYQVAAFQGNHVSHRTPPLCVTLPPSTPGEFKAAPVDQTHIKLTWGEVGGEQGFRIFEGQTVIARPKAGHTSFVVSGLSPGTKHCYAIVAFNAGGASVKSPPDCAKTEHPAPTTPPPSTPSPTPSPTTPPATSPPAAPSGLSISGGVLSWTDNSNNEQGFRIYRGTTLIATVGANVTSHTVGTSSACYHVVAYNSAGSASSATRCV
jgi:hypothetical protein